MDMNRIAPLQYDSATNRVGEVVERNGKQTVDWHGGGQDSMMLLVAKTNQTIAELEKLQHICFALSKVATEKPDTQDAGDGKADRP